MRSTGNVPLVSPIEGLLATSAVPLPYQRNVQLRSYLLQRSQGNVLVYNSPGLTESSTAICAEGTPTRLLINHGHEAMFGQPALDVPIWAPEKDRSELAASIDIVGTFDEREMIDDDLEAIPTPGHTAGTTSYLWDNGAHRFLFTGDFIWIENQEWKAVVLDSTLRGDYLNSLALVRSIDFDVLVPWGTTMGDPSFGLVKNEADRHHRIDAIIDRVQAGGNR